MLKNIHTFRLDTETFSQKHKRHDSFFCTLTLWTHRKKRSIVLADAQFLLLFLSIHFDVFTTFIFIFLFWSDSREFSADIPIHVEKSAAFFHVEHLLDMSFSITMFSLLFDTNKDLYLISFELVRYCLSFLWKNCYNNAEVQTTVARTSSLKMLVSPQDKE